MATAGLEVNMAEHVRSSPSVGRRINTALSTVGYDLASCVYGKHTEPKTLCTVCVSDYHYVFDLCSGFA